MKLPITLTPDETGGFVVECPAIPGCVSEGDTREEALANIRLAIDVCLRARAELGLPLTIEVAELDIPVGEAA